MALLLLIVSRTLSPCSCYEIIQRETSNIISVIKNITMITSTTNPYSSVKFQMLLHFPEHHGQDYDHVEFGDSFSNFVSF